MVRRFSYFVVEGCNGGDTPTAYQYVMSAGGLETEAAYPYRSGDGSTGHCAEVRSKLVAKFDGFDRITSAHNLNETAMMVYLYEQAPLSICVDAESWQFYNKGKECPSMRKCKVAIAMGKSRPPSSGTVLKAS